MMRTLILCLACFGAVRPRSTTPSATIATPPKPSTSTQTNVCNDSLTAYLPDSSYTASTDYTNKDPAHNYAPYRARLDVKVDPDPKAYKVGAWVPQTLDTNQWLQVNLTNPGVIQTVTTEGRNPDPINGCCDQWVTKYSVDYSLDGTTWTTVTDSTGADKIFDGNTDSDTPVTNDLGCPVIAQYIRIKPQEWHKHIALRIDLNGCQIAPPTTPGPSTLPTPSTSTQTTLVAGALSNGQCVSDCSTKADGYYQSCQGCDVYVKCFNNKITDNNPCPPGNVWNDNIKFCDKHSTTCQGPTTTGGPTTTTMPAGQLSSGQCVNDCTNKADGFYQSCMGCEYFAKCFGHVLTDGKPCPTGTVWNDNIKFCDKSSTTCSGTQQPQTTSTLPPPTTPTTSIPTTTPTTTYPTTTPTTTSTPTTTMKPTTTTMTPVPTNPPTTTVKSGSSGVQMPHKGMCVSDCTNLPNGDYQSCRGCNVFISCSSGYSYDGKLCPAHLVWNDDNKFCDHTSTTCQ